MRFFYIFIFLFANTLFAQVRLPKLVSDGMVLQRNSNVRIWGWASEGEDIEVSFQQRNYNTSTKNGKWEILLENPNIGGPYTMQISGKNSIQLDSIYIGDVWLCSGQSNMELPMSRVAPKYPEEIKSADNAEIRYFQVPKEYNLTKKLDDFSGGNWISVNQNTIEGFAAIPYFFAKNLYEEYQIPIGLIDASLGGSPVEAWMSEKALKNFPEAIAEVEKLKPEGVIDSLEQLDQNWIRNWYTTVTAEDAGLKSGWKTANFDDSDWEEFELPGLLKQPINGVVWFRKKFDLKSEFSGKPAELLMGRIVDADSVFVNGTFVGNTTYQYPPRRYQIPENILREGENTITVKLISERGRGGFVTDKPYEINFPEKRIDLKGAWKYKVGKATEALQPQTFYRWKPTGLYNAMIHPLLKYSIKGAIWYQGESNTSEPEKYSELFPKMIESWRENWHQEASNFPFLFVQLANFMESRENPTDTNWARLREAQKAALNVPKTGMAVTIDVGEWNDIHPLDKKTVSDRLATAAKHLAYGDASVVPSGPIYTSSEIKNDSIILHFEAVGSGLKIKNNQELKGFAIAGNDKQFVWAKAKIEGDKVIVYSPQVKHPVAVRYAWADNPENANLYNKEDLPASPFRTDQWKQNR
ncbi:MAG: sialate O-acetylesterase [Zunongwangia sp.]|jgi:sialate O-acetylesterase|uniref:Sialate O-acetylesterase n=1 Tax=Zunongwangia profunda TaxID=398743 RepID=A0A3D5J508_9FLAO|nr:sialate O-acetylesterase [Zunongwangia profunda]MAO38602.1 sialate O-acetylesterase [Zunongwangia sp.]MAS72389.1 sialate O-acetylesterase [Zunongwangia sp.]MCC4230730.1 beta galactosidase jelly roll domain-containing protein [Zunongwangia profunda]HAJ81113.1 sialate O-acetylesterase [Zunongwangia profunda]HCV83165.1 sialate O-acetylesterase [Zunongwangia profunda]|tara:strand:- start:11873 stop:13792 length:1920 start_codon:yes stop_codon:yes gene_type:complete